MVSRHPLWSANGLQNTPNGLHIICSVGKYLSMVEFSKATNKDYTKLLVTIEMIEYVFAKYGNKWHIEDDIVDVILKDLWMKYRKYDKGNEKVHDLENRIEKLDVDKEAKQAKHDQLKVNKDDKGKGKVQAEHDHLKVIKICILVVLKVNQISSDGDVSSDEGVFGDEDLVLFNDVKYPLTDAKIMMFKERPTRSRALTRQVASTSTRSRALTR
ncbi:hypothetical protein Tco_0530912 [Tanacetum coccineum]